MLCPSTAHSVFNSLRSCVWKIWLLSFLFLRIHLRHFFINDHASILSCRPKSSHDSSRTAFTAAWIQGAHFEHFKAQTLYRNENIFVMDEKNSRRQSPAIHRHCDMTNHKNVSLKCHAIWPTIFVNHKVHYPLQSLLFICTQICRMIHINRLDWRERDERKKSKQITEISILSPNLNEETKKDYKTPKNVIRYALSG